MLLLEALEITQGAPELKIDLVDSPLEESCQFKGVLCLLLGILGLRVVRIPFPQVIQLRLQVLLLVLILLDHFVTEMRALC